MFRSVLLILSGNLSSAVITMVRSLVIARLISVEDFGIASTFLLATAIVEMASALGLQQQIVQSKNGNDPHLQAALQGFQALRGVTNGVILFLLAGPLANFFGIPELTWAYQLVALLPVFRGFTHLDSHRLSRQMNYVPVMLTTALPPLGSLLLLWPLSMVFGDYRLMLYALLAQSILILVMSHLVAKRPYRLALDRSVTAGSLRFGWPLLLNGVLMFAIFNAERMIVGRELGMTALGLFSMAFSLALSPTLVMAKSGMSFFLPQLSAAHDRTAFRNLAMTTFEAHLVFGNILVVSIALLGGPFLHLALGEKYAGAIPLLTWLAIMQGVRVIKGGSSTVALARAHTGNAMVANILRAALLPLAWWVAATGGDLMLIIWIGIAGEVAGFVIALLLALWRLDLPRRPLVWPLLTSTALFVAAGFHARAQYDAAHWIPDPWTGALLVILFGLALLSMRDLRRYVSARSLTQHKE